MDYFALTKTFWDEAPELDGFKPDYAALFFAIADSVNRNLWKETEIEYDRMINKTKMGKRMYLAGRNWLQDNNFVTYTKGSNDYARAKFNVAVRFYTATDTATGTTINTSTAPQVSTNCTPTVPYLNKTKDYNTNKPKNLKTDVDADRVDVEEVFLDEEKKIEPPPKVAPKGSPTLHATLKEIIEKMNEGYYWQAKDGKALKGIITKISFRWKNKHGADPRDADVITSFRWMMDNLPEWFRDKWDTSLIESKFEVIIKQILEDRKNGKSNSNSQSTGGISPRLQEAWELLAKSRESVRT